MDTLPCCKGKTHKKIFSILHKMIIMLICLVMINYVGVGLVNITSKETEQISMIEEKKEERDFKPTSRGTVRRMPETKLYTVYKLIIEDKEFVFDNLSTAELYKNKLETGTENTVSGDIKVVSQSYVDNLANENEILEYVENLIYEYNKGKTFYPTISHRISSLYGGRKSPTVGASSFHKGIDISGNYGDNVYAYKYGKVISSGYNSGGYGNMILIKHEDGSSTRYAHLSSVLVSVGDTVYGGQMIGRVGSTGISTGNHLHFEVLINGSNVNPYNYIF